MRVMRAAREAVQSRTGRQSALHFAAQIAAALLGLAVYTMLTRGLGVVGFGRWSVVMAFFTFSSVFFDFGISVASKRLAAVSVTRSDERAVLGAALAVSLAIGAAYVLVTVLASAVYGLAGDTAMAALLLATAPLALAYPVQELVLSSALGANRIGMLSLMLVLPRVFMLAAAALLVHAGALTALSASIAMPGSMLLGAVVLLIAMRPDLGAVRARLPVLRREMREFGRQVYLGRMVDGLTTGFDRLIINGFRGAVPAGFYNIAATMSQPLGMLSRATSASAYRSLASADRIPRKLLIANLLWCTAGAVALVAACEVLIPVFFTHAYNDALALLPVVAAGTALAGLNEPFHAFLSARRQGRALKVMSIATSLTTVTLNFVLIPVAGAMGAGIAMTASYALNIVLNLHYYRTFLHSTAAERAA